MQTNQATTWTVVQFIDDGTVEAVPTTWIQGDFCHWPSFAQHKLLSAIRKCEPLNTCWPMHKVKIFRNATFDDYMKARNNAKVAEETSDLNTADENENGNVTKRKRVQKILSSSDDSIDKSVLSSPPKIKKPKSKVGRSTEKKHINEEKENLDLSEVNLLLTSDPKNEFEKIKQDVLLSKFIGLSIPSDKPQQSLISLQESSSSGFDILQLQYQKCNEKDKNFKTLLQQNHILRSLITDTLSEIKEMKNLLIQRTAMASLEVQDKQTFFKTAGINFPINSEEELEHLEQILQNEETFQNAVNELFKLGGSSVYDVVKRISSVMTKL